MRPVEVKVRISGKMELHYDENSREFKDAFNSYKTRFPSPANVTDMLETVVWCMVNDGYVSSDWEIGYVLVNGEKVPSALDEADGVKWSGINVIGKFDNADRTLTLVPHSKEMYFVGFD
jgi:hypothetical protein